MLTTFHFEIHKDVGFASDKFTGENSHAYMKVENPIHRSLDEKEYKQVHELEAVEMVSKKINIENFLIKPITMDEFLENNPNHESTDNKLEYKF